MWHEGRPIHLPPDEIGEPKVIVDLGCNVGITVDGYAIAYPEAQIIGVELDVNNFNIAKMVLDHYGDRVKLLNSVVWTHDGQVDCQIWGTETNYVKDTNAHANGQHHSYARTVECKTLDTIIIDYDVVDFIKFDIEGSEHAILKQGGDWVDKTRSIFVEIHDITNDNVRKLVENLGFRVVKEDFEIIWAVKQ